ncbi:unnamed protein product [Peronospora belbahrii]|uniref:Uncharacterized protein n=1 Tax=Peronospora belbahrii TaxID=622444 RepID=A0ABN8CQ84_9STRA|nr:unnamed protein product [Peronospora belbahrii]
MMVREMSDSILAAPKGATVRLMKDERNSLVRWLHFYAISAEKDYVSIALRLLHVAFPTVLSDLQGWKAVVNSLEWFYETSLALDIQELDD